MATLNHRRAAIFGTVSGNAPQVLSFPEKASQDFKAGALLTLDFGYVAEETVDTSILILGLALGDSHNSSSSGDELAEAAIANRDTLFALSITNNGTLASSTGVTSKTLVGKSYGLIISGEKVVCDISDQTNRRFMVVALHPEDTEGDTNGRVVGFFLPQFTQLYGTS